MIAVNLSRYLEYTRQDPADPVKYGARLMQWSAYVKHRIRRLDAAEELRLLEEDEKTMGSAGWYK